MKIRDLLKTNKSSRRRKPIHPLVIAIIVFIIAVVVYNVYVYKNLIPEHTYYVDTLDSTFPIVYQERNNKKLNEMRGYRNDEYRDVSNNTLTILEAERKLNLLIKNNGAHFNIIEYEVRNKTSNRLLERTKMEILDENRDKKNDETRISLNIQNLIKQNTTYLFTLKINLPDKQVYYFTNIQYNPKNNLNEAVSQVEDFTLKTFDEKAAADYDKGIVKYLETSINRDTKEMYNVTLQQTR